ncbi:hypothetical protein CU102_19395 [Phyllobacterium brassicacearum]|uniref:Uncharacterized protein n=1 Tax=Phyllobacterium brassicacearum TaxID=314235 RepID=A0A2P7BH25_9HYPH|nr:hypothetical protein [Phyllobacterium brassicacearum]PSH65770.1 hypothetical protein CU102_19395 [Phyllobacterium brassicacearum]TDQ16861.1 hypothetical protein DEV91_12923 [Phyllobacterium brassicacearum]
MKHHALEQLQIVAEVSQDHPRQIMSRNERLERWAELLDRDPGRRLSTLHQTEYQPIRERTAMRNDGSPISVAFEDPVFRAAGLENDSYGEAKRFFELTDHQLHRVICYCHFGETVNAATAAYHIRKALTGKQRGVFARLHEMFAG